MQKTEFTVSNRTVLRIILLVLGVILALNVIGSLAFVLKLLLISLFLATALSPIVNFMGNHLKLKKRGASVAITIALFVVIVITVMSLIVPNLVRQTIDFVRDAPETVQSWKEGQSAAGRFIQRYNLEPQLDGLSANLRERTKNITEPVIATAGRIGSALISILTVFALTVMMLLEGPSWAKKYWAMLPPGKKKHQQKIAQGMYRMVTGYFIGQVILALISATVYFVALVLISTIMNVSINAVALAGILFFTGLIPMIGHIIGGVIVFLACMFVSLPLAIAMVIVIIVFQQVENMTIQPYIQAKYNELTPLLVFIAALVGISIGGLLGGFVAIPIAGCLKILLQDYLSRRNKELART